MWLSWFVSSLENIRFTGVKLAFHTFDNPITNTCNMLTFKRFNYKPVILYKVAILLPLGCAYRSFNAWSLRTNPNVVVMERTNARTLIPDAFEAALDLVTIDVSFISLRIILPVVEKLLSVDGRVIALVKPQFEAGRAAIGKGGVVRDPSVHLSVLERTAEFLSTNTSLTLNGCTFSPLRGPSGNIEFLFDMLRIPHLSTEPTDFNSIVEEAHSTLSPGGDRVAQNS